MGGPEAPLRPPSFATFEVTASMGPIRSPSGESARHEDAQKRLISATAAAQKRRVRGLAYESPAALRGWRSGEQAGTCSAVLGAAGESRERGRGWPPRAAKAKYRTILRRSERKAVSWLWGGAVLRGVKRPSWKHKSYAYCNLRKACLASGPAAFPRGRFLACPGPLDLRVAPCCREDGSIFCGQCSQSGDPGKRGGRGLRAILNCSL